MSAGETVKERIPDGCSDQKERELCAEKPQKSRLKCLHSVAFVVV